MAIVLDTLRSLHEHGYRLSVFCRPCGRHVFLDLPALIAAGEGGRAVVGLRVRCHLCSGRGELSIISTSMPSWGSRRYPLGGVGGLCYWRA